MVSGLIFSWRIWPYFRLASTNYSGFEKVMIPLSEWQAKWLPGLERDGIRVGLNWSGNRATGYDVEPTAALTSLTTRQSSQ
ncbi:DUF2750 domain-containing protein [Pseudarthrobacter chlorophenolicus]|uniref:DUF2750 domain-containing protein n=1 Tax=Pseudarthrobacter chlorophenolicus TaxID=85085 RepID=UPI0009E43432